MRRVMLAAVLVLLSATATFAQELVVRFYLVPKIGVGTRLDPFRAKYVYARDGGAGLSDPQFETMDYGLEPIMLVAALTTLEEDAAMNAHLDVLAIPAPLDDAVSGVELSALQTRLESMKIPGAWITSARTHRQVMRFIAQAIVFFQRYRGLFGESPFAGDAALDTRLNQISAASRTQLAATADSFGLDRTAITTTMTLRDALMTLLVQLPGLTLRGEPL